MALNKLHSTSTENAHALETPGIFRDSRPPAASAKVVNNEELRYSVYSGTEKLLIVAMVGLAGLFSPLPANIYFPAIPQLTEVFSKSTESLNLTVTVYLILQGISPMIWGPASDYFGRRLIYLPCLLILICSCLVLALTPTSAFWLLIFMRCLQACGGASTIALGAGVVGDIATKAERGGYYAIFNVGPMLAPCVGPAIGGALAEALGWRSIFWFLTIISCCCFVVIILFLPETLQSLVGNGSIEPPVLHRPILSILGRKKRTSEKENVKITRLPFANPLKLLAYPDVVLTLFFTGVVFAVNYTITATISSNFAIIYPYLSETDVGLCYLGTGFGMLVGSTLTGKLLDRDIRRMTQHSQKNTGICEVAQPDLPIEYARLRTMPFHLLAFVACTASWGWCLEKSAPLAVPLILQFIRYTALALLNSVSTLMIDICPGQSSSVTACNNLLRCSFAALLVSFIDKATSSLGLGWTFVLLGGICLLLVPLIIVEVKLGPKYRWKRQK